MENRRAKLIAEIISYLENMDAQDLQGSMKPPEAAPMEGEVLPVEGEMVAEVEAPMPPQEGDDMDDDELEELAKLSG